MTHLVTLMLCTTAFAALALAMERQQENLLGRVLPATTTRWLRMAGWAVLLSALAIVVKGQGWSIGLVSFSGHTSLGAGLVFGALVVIARRKSRQSTRR